jgi:hypothetical protein
LTAAPKNATPRWRCIGLRQGYFLFVGTLQPRKNVERLLEAYLALPPVLRSARQLVIVGAPGWRSEELVKRIKDAQQRGENVVWLDQLTDNRQLRHLYAGAGAFISRRCTRASACRCWRRLPRRAGGLLGHHLAAGSGERRGARIRSAVGGRYHRRHDHAGARRRAARALHRRRPAPRAGTDLG